MSFIRTISSSARAALNVIWHNATIYATKPAKKAECEQAVKTFEENRRLERRGADQAIIMLVEAIMGLSRSSTNVEKGSRA